MAFTTCDCANSTIRFLGRPEDDLLIFPDVVPLVSSPPPLPSLLPSSSLFLAEPPAPLPPQEADQSSIEPYVQKKKRAPRKTRMSKRKLTDEEGYVFVDDTVSVKGGKPAKQKKGSKGGVCEDTVAKTAVSDGGQTEESKTRGEKKEVKEKKFTYNPHSRRVFRNGNDSLDLEYLRSRMSERMIFCRRNQLQWHVQRVVTQVIHDMCLGCKNNCQTDHTICHRSPAYVLSTYPETCARMLLQKDEFGSAICDIQFLEQLKLYDVVKESAVRLPSSILVSYFSSLYPDASWLDTVLKPFLSFPSYGFAPPRFDFSNSKEVMAEVMTGVLSFSPCYSFFFKWTKNTALRQSQETW